jgi:CheY-like chemotaxis protein
VSDLRVLVVEDGFEYSETLERFLSDGFQWERSGSGPHALSRLAEEAFDRVFLDMRFDRAPQDELLGDLEAVADQFNGDPVQARNFLEDHQGNYILAAIRERGHGVPVLMSYDFDIEPRRWKRLRERYAPVDYLPDSASPEEIARLLKGLTPS